MKKKTMGVLLTILLLSVYGISVNAKKGKKGGNPLDEIWDYINSVINPTLEDHADRITALEGSVGPLEQPIRIGMTSATTWEYENTVCLAAIAEADINQYVEGLGLDMTFEFIVTDNGGDEYVYVQGYGDRSHTRSSLVRSMLSFFKLRQHDEYAALKWLFDSS